MEQGLAHQFQAVPRRRARLGVGLDDLEEILSLPAWKRRHELYSAWIFTLLLQSLRDHDVKLHHDNGRIAFAFRETLLATVLSKTVPLEIYAERRTPAINLTGHARKAAVQPDYSVWPSGSGACKLVIECKQYKKSSTRNFADALNDYAAALRGARVVLANYGPVSPSVDDAIKDDRRDRCVAIGYVHPEEPRGCEKFCQVVREVIGKPEGSYQSAVRALSSDMQPKADLLVIDVSGSTRTGINTPAGLQLVAALVQRLGITRLASADDRLLSEVGVGRDDIEQALSRTGTGRTDLGAPVAELRRERNAVFVLADEEGIRTVTGARVRTVGSFSLGRLTLHLAHVS